MQLENSGKGQRVVFREGEKIDLCVLNKERHFENCIRFINNPRINDKMLVGNFPVQFTQEEKWFSELGNDDTNIILAIETKEGKYLGNVGLHRIDWISRNAEMGIFIGDEEEHSKGYGTEAKLIMGMHGFSLGLVKIYAKIFADNVASLRAAEKNGAHIEGTLKKHLYKSGKWHDLVVVSYFNE